MVKKKKGVASSRIKFSSSSQMSVIGPGSPYNLIRVKPNQKKKLKKPKKKIKQNNKTKQKKKNINNSRRFTDLEQKEHTGFLWMSINIFIYLLERTRLSSLHVRT